MTLKFPGESTEYRAARDRLLEQESEQRYVYLRSELLEWLMGR